MPFDLITPIFDLICACNSTSDGQGIEDDGTRFSSTPVYIFGGISAGILISLCLCTIWSRCTTRDDHYEMEDPLSPERKDILPSHEQKVALEVKELKIATHRKENIINTFNHRADEYVAVVAQPVTPIVMLEEKIPLPRKKSRSENSLSSKLFSRTRLRRSVVSISQSEPTLTMR